MSLFKPVKTVEGFWIDPRKIKIHPVLALLFIYNIVRAKDIGKRIKQKYNTDFPIILWGEYLVDGRHRTEGAIFYDVKKVFAVNIDFPNLEAAIDYALQRQGDQSEGRDTRNNNAELLQCVITLDTRNNYKKSETNNPVCGSREPDTNKEELRSQLKVRIAKNLGVSVTTIQRCFTVIDETEIQNQHIRQQILTGELTINQAYKVFRPGNSGEEKEPAIKEKNNNTITLEQDSIILKNNAHEIRLLTIAPRINYISARKYDTFVRDVLALCIKHFRNWRIKKQS